VVQNTLLSRLGDKRTGAIAAVMQRVHMDDLTGFLMGQSKEWETPSLSAIAEANGRDGLPFSWSGARAEARGGSRGLQAASRGKSRLRHLQSSSE
jgi:hypothetical protein